MARNSLAAIDDLLWEMVDSTRQKWDRERYIDDVEVEFLLKMKRLVQEGDVAQATIGALERLPDEQIIELHDRLEQALPRPEEL